ncbi:MAG: arsenate reductase ArsC [Candidatus Thorarchaeota archaeon]
MFRMHSLEKQEFEGMNMQRVLFLCTGNSARSQMSEALLKHHGGEDFEVFSAGTKPQSEVNPIALEVLSERGIPTDELYTKLVNDFVDCKFDLVVTVCDKAKQSCPHFPRARRMDHWPLEDPAAAEGTYEEVLIVFRETRDEIERRIKELILKS